MSVPFVISVMMDWFCIGGIQNVQGGKSLKISTIPHNIYFQKQKRV